MDLKGVIAEFFIS